MLPDSKDDEELFLLCFSNFPTKMEEDDQNPKIQGGGPGCLEKIQTEADFFPGWLPLDFPQGKGELINTQTNIANKAKAISAKLLELKLKN